MRSWSDFVSEGHIPSSLVQEKPIIALYGFFQIGKSTLINCFMRRYVALTGKGLATTSFTARFRYGNEESIQYRTNSGELRAITLDILRENPPADICTNGSFHIEVRIPGEILKHCNIVDTPGFNADAEDTNLAFSVIGNVNYCLFVIPNRGLTDIEKNLLVKIARKKIPMSLIMNCTEGRREEAWLPLHPVNQEILEENQSWLSANGIDVLHIGGEKIFSCNALFYWSQQRDFEKSKPHIKQADTVMKHICGLLKDEGEDCSQESILSLSRIPQLFQHIKHRIENYDPVSHKWR